MAHISENEFADKLEEHYSEAYGAESVDREHHLDRTGRYVDFWIETPDVILAVEVENDAEHLSAGLSQSLLYAAHDKRAVPVVAYPEGHVEEPELSMLADQTPAIYLPYDFDLAAE